MIKHVICTDNSRASLTIGRVYTVFNQTTDYYKVKNDSKILTYYVKSRFKDCNICLDRKCNSCKLNRKGNEWLIGRWE